MAGLLPLVWPMADPGRTVSMASVAVSGVLFGLCAGTSSPAAVVLGLIALVFLVAQSRALGQFVKLGMIWAILAAAVLAVVIVPILVNHPDAYRQYLGHVKWLAESNPATRWERIAYVLTYWPRLSFPICGIFLLGLATVVSALRRTRLQDWILLWLGPYAGFMLVLLDTHNIGYFWLLGPYTLAANSVTLSDPRLAPAGLGAYISRGLVVLLVLYGSIELAKQTIILATLPETQSMEYNARLLRDLIPRGSTVAAYDAWWFLGSDYSIRDRHWVPRKYWCELDYVVFQDPQLDWKGVEPGLDDYVQSQFRLIHDGRSRSPFTVLGVRLSTSHTGFGARVFARR
jgi:hypothetical protein